MTQRLVIHLTDDMDGTDASETVTFALDEQAYEIDLSTENAKKLRRAIQPFIEKARKPRRSPTSRSGNRSPTVASKVRTVFSNLQPEEKDRFRRWANMPTTRRISDEKVKDWLDAGRP